MKNFKNKGNNNNISKKFVSRKTKRKMEREEKKNKKNYFYKNRNNKEALKDVKIQDQKKKANKSFNNNNNIQENYIRKRNKNSKNNFNKNSKNNKYDLDLNESESDSSFYEKQKHNKEVIDSEFDDEIDSELGSMYSSTLSDQEAESQSENSNNNSDEEQRSDENSLGNKAKNNFKQNDEIDMEEDDEEISKMLNRKNKRKNMEKISLNKIMKRNLTELEDELSNEKDNDNFRMEGSDQFEDSDSEALEGYNEDMENEDFDGNDNEQEEFKDLEDDEEIENEDFERIDNDQEEFEDLEDNEDMEINEKNEEFEEFEDIENEQEEFEDKENSQNPKANYDNYEGFDDEDEEDSEEEDNNINKKNSKLKEMEDKLYMNKLQVNYDDLDDEIDQLEKKLGIKKKDKYNRMKKTFASENYDEDIFDFLDNIDKIVEEKKSKKIIEKDTENPLPNPEDKSKENKSKENKSKENSQINKKDKANKLNNPNNSNSDEEQSSEFESLEALKAKSKLFNKNKISNEQNLKNQLNKEIISILNKISEGNLAILISEFTEKLDKFELEFTKISNRKNALISLFEISSKLCLKLISEQIITNITISSCIASYISILHFKYGNCFMLYFIKTLLDNFNKNFEIYSLEKNSNLSQSNNTINNNDFNNLSNKPELKNLMFLLIQFYLYGNLSAKLYYDLIKKFIENFSDLSSELLLVILSYLGIELRKDDPESLKEIFRKIQQKFNSLQASNKVFNLKDPKGNSINSINNNNNIDNKKEKNNFIEKLMNLNNNKNNSSNDNDNNKPSSKLGKLKYIVEMIEEIKNNKFMKFNLNEKFNFFRNFVNNNKKKFSGENNYNTLSEKIADKIDISLEAIRTFDKEKLEDFIKTSAESSSVKVDDFVLENLDDIDIDNNILINNNKLEAKMQKLKLTTDLKKRIFKAIVGASDFIDAYERVNRLNLKKDQAREIIKIIVLLVGNEKKYNSFYKLLIEKLMQFERDHKYTYHYTIWDHMRIMDSFKESKITNLAKLTSDLLVSEKIALPVFLQFEFEEAKKEGKMFVIKCLDYFFSNKKNTPEKTKIIFAKLVKNDEHVEFAKMLFAFLKNTFKRSKIVELDKKSQDYFDIMNSALKVLSRVL